MSNKLSCKEARILMMGLIDNELTDKEKRDVLDHIETCASCRERYNSFIKLKEEEGKMKEMPLSEEIFDEYWTHIYNRIERATGWIILSIGAILTFSYTAFLSLKTFFYDDNNPIILKLGVAFLIFGIIIVFVSALREKMRIRKSDKYRSIQR